MTAGRPKRSDEEIKVLCDKIIEWSLKDDSYTLEEFSAITMGVSRSTLNAWCDQYPKFSEAFKRAKNILANRWLKGALTNKLNPYAVNNFYYQLSTEHQEWLRELKDKSKEEKNVTVVLPDYFKKTPPKE